MRIETFGWWDIPAALDIEHEFFHLQPWTEGQFWSELAADNRYFIAAMEDDVLIGYADLFINTPDAEVQTIAVRGSAQGRGVGTELLTSMLAAAIEHRCMRILLEVRADNARAIGLYEKHGFVVNGRRPDYYALGVDAVLMERHV